MADHLWQLEKYSALYFKTLKLSWRGLVNFEMLQDPRKAHLCCNCPSFFHEKNLQSSAWMKPSLSFISATFPNISFSCSYSYMIACQVRTPFHWFNCSKPCLSYSSSPSAPLLNFWLIWALSFVDRLLLLKAFPSSDRAHNKLSALSTVLDYHLFMVLLFLRDMLFLIIFIILLSFHFFLAIFIFPRFYFCSLSFSQVLFFCSIFFHTFYFSPITVWLS